MKEQDYGVRWFNTIFYPNKKIVPASRYEDGVLPRLREQDITLFTPWGPKYKWEIRGAVIQSMDKEVEVLKFLATMLEEWKKKMPNKNWRWVFLGADLYGIRINNLPSEIINRYFISLAEWLKQILPEAEFLLWSEFDDMAEEYRQKVREKFDTFVDDELLQRATRTAQAMKTGGNPKEYLIERFAEAMLIEELLNPIKISCVGKHKDAEVDWQLPCLYFLPERLHAPWL